MGRSPSASDILRDSTQEILARWESNVRREILSARHQATLLLQNQLPAFLQCIASELKLETSGQRPCDPQTIREHGEQRAASLHYSLSDLLGEYELLREAIFEVLECQITLTRDERDRILSMIGHGIAEAASEYVRIQESFREQCVAILAHDLRNPVTVARTSAQLILESLQRPELCRKLAERIDASLTRVDGMIDDLLDFWRLRAGQPLQIQVEPTELRALTRRVLEELKTIHGNRFRLTAPEEIQGTWCPEGLSRCIENLANNAVKYGSSDQPITISLLSSGDHVEISVHNLGDPIDEQEQAKLFDPFFRGKTALLSRHRGWGLGLILVKEMVEAHHGAVSVKSSTQEGTTFTLRFPRIVSPMAFEAPR
ncbi:MAG: sensor histidine kinase [Oligoflexia bacterium]|nr:sensor histidine kinase [Oligoflexia bacterium]